MKSCGGTDFSNPEVHRQTFCRHVMLALDKLIYHQNNSSSVVDHDTFMTHVRSYGVTDIKSPKEDLPGHSLYVDFKEE